MLERLETEDGTGQREAIKVLTKLSLAAWAILWHSRVLRNEHDHEILNQSRMKRLQQFTKREKGKIAGGNKLAQAIVQVGVN